MERVTWSPSRKYGRLGVTGVAAVAALILIFIAGWVLDRRGASEADRRLAAFVKDEAVDPVDLIVRGARAKRIVFLSDIHNSAAVKQLAARAIARIAESPGLDAVIVEVAADQQPYIDRYLSRAPEDASILLTHARTLGQPGAATRASLDLYRTIWKLNQQLGADQRIRVIAADLPGWPPAAPSPGETGRLMRERADHMEETIRSEVLATFPDARVFVFMSGLHALKSGAVAFRTGGSTPVTVTPLAARLAASTDEVYSVFVDAPAGGFSGREVAPYAGTRIAAVLAEAGTRKGLAVRSASAFDHVRHPILEKKVPGIEFNIEPRSYTLRSVADGYIYLGN